MDHHTPLLHGGLPRPNGHNVHATQDHPVFLRASHSPWRCIPQNVLVVFRGIVLAYLFLVFVCGINYKLGLDSKDNDWRHIFDFAVVSFILVLIYHIITFCWTFTHLYYPHLDETGGGIESHIISAMSLPHNMGSLRKQFYFTLFYVVTVVFAFMNSLIYWIITHQQKAPAKPAEPPKPEPEKPKEPEPSVAPGPEGIIWGWGADTSMIMAPPPKAPFSELFGKGWFSNFNILNLYAISSLIMIIEIILFNSIKRPITIGSHIIALIFFAGLYLGWAAIGHLATKTYAFDWLDQKKVGSEEAVTLYCIGFVILAPLVYILLHGFIGIREALTRSMDYSRNQAVAAANHNGRHGFYDNP